MSDDHPALPQTDDRRTAAVMEQDDGTHIVQVLRECHPSEDPHGDGAVLEEEFRVDGVVHR